MSHPPRRRFRGQAAVRSRLCEVTPTAAQPSADVDSPADRMLTAVTQLEDELATALLARLRSAPPDFLERTVLRLLQAMGYGAVARWVGRSGDRGIDGCVESDPLGLDRVCVQAKRFAEGQPVGADAIRDFFGALDRAKAAKGVFVTTSAFMPGAIDTAAALSKAVVLIDGPRLARLMIQHEVGCVVVERHAVRVLDESFFAQGGAASCDAQERADEAA